MLVRCLLTAQCCRACLYEVDREDVDGILVTRPPQVQPPDDQLQAKISNDLYSPKKSDGFGWAQNCKYKKKIDEDSRSNRST